MKSISRNIVKSVFDTDARIAFVAICIFGVVALILQQRFILTDEVYFNTWGEQLTHERLETFITDKRDREWISYSFVPFLVLLQIFLISVCLSTGVLIENKKIQFKKIFLMVTKVSIIPAFTKVITLLFIFSFVPIRTFDDMTHAFSFSLANCFSKDLIPQWLIYPLITINLFEIIFFFFLAYGVKSLLMENFKRSFLFVGYTYGTGLLFWILFIVFIQISLT